MDFLKTIINSQAHKLCFLCFNRNDNLESISKKLFISYENNSTTASVHDMMMYLFPFHEILSQDICRVCSDVILSMYLTLQRYEARKSIYSIITDNLLDGIGKDVQMIKESYKLHIEIPKLDDKESKCNERTTDTKMQSIKDEVIPSEELCSKPKIITRVKVKSHLQKLGKNEATVCEICGKDCKKPNTLKAHLNCHSEKNCPYCFKTLKTHSHFKIHVKCHEGINKVQKKDVNFYYCNDCEYRTLNKSSLQAHINKYHLRERPFICEICSKGFYKKSNLTEHIQTHKNTKNLTCEQCGDNFVCKKTLTEHLRLHSGEKPFRCNTCDATFVTSGRRSDHIKRKHGIKSECCTICGKKYSLKKDLNWHMKMVHVKSKDGSKIQLLEKNYEFLDNNSDVLPVLSSI